MAKRLDLYDYKILHELDKNARASASEIANRCRLSKVSANHRIKRLQERKIIERFMIHVDYTRLGYNTNHIFYKLQNITAENEEEFYSYLSQHNMIGYVARIDGSFDMFMVILSKNNEDLDKTLSAINHKFGQYIKQRDILPVVHAQYFGRRYLIGKKEFIRPDIRKKQEKIIKMDKTDHKILQTLSNNARIPIIKLADRLKITKDVAHYRIKELIRKGILQKFTINLNHEMFGNSFFKILIVLNYKSDEKEFLSKISNYNNLIRVIRLLGSCDIEMDFEVKDNREMRNILKEIKEKLGEYIQSIDTLFVYQIDKLNYYPF